MNLNLDNDIMQLERRVFMKRSLSKLMVKPQSIGCRINSALISVKHYKERLYRRRNVLSKAAKRYLEASYSIGCYPNKIERERIAKSCNLSPQQVRVWVCTIGFQSFIHSTNFSLVIGAIATRAEKMQ